MAEVGVGEHGRRRPGRCQPDDRQAVKNLGVFDLDGTLAVSKSEVDPEMAGLFDSLLGMVKVALISGG